MYIRIVSLFAMSDPLSDGEFTWEGNLAFPLLDDPSLRESNERTCEIIFRLFNRVNEDDGIRLESIAYNLPSLSMGDLIGFDNGDDMMLLYRVMPIGFEGVVAGVG